MPSSDAVSLLDPEANPNVDTFATGNSSNVTASIINAKAQNAAILNANARPVSVASVQATSRRNYELYSRGNEQNLSGASPGTAPPSTRFGARGRVDADSESFFDVDAPAMPVQPLRVSGSSNVPSSVPPNV